MAKAPGFKLGGHLNPLGQQAVAAGIADFLVRAGLVDETLKPEGSAKPARIR